MNSIFKNAYTSTAEKRAINMKIPKGETDRIEMVLCCNAFRNWGYDPRPEEPLNEMLHTSTALIYNSLCCYAFYFIIEFCKNG